MTKCDLCFSPISKVSRGQRKRPGTLICLHLTNWINNSLRILGTNEAKVNKNQPANSNTTLSIVQLSSIHLLWHLAFIGPNQKKQPEVNSVEFSVCHLNKVNSHTAVSEKYYFSELKPTIYCCIKAVDC